MALRNFAYNAGIFRSYSFEVPLICVGNLSVGGTGKTPHVIYLAELLIAEGYKVGVLSRGYGRQSEGFQLADSGSSSKEIGDEPKEIISRIPQLVLAVCNSRVEGLNRLMDLSLALDVVLLDDAFQHRAVNPGYSILLTKYSNPYYKDMVLPAGRLREFTTGRKRADLILLTKCPLEIDDTIKKEEERKLGIQSGQSLYFSQINYTKIRGLFKTDQKLSLGEKKNTIYLLTAIASTRELKEYLTGNSERLEQFAYPDHHHFKEEELRKNLTLFERDVSNDKVIITTAKDAVKLKNFEFLREYPVFVVETKIGIDREEEFKNELLHYMNTAKKN